jgi:hypothetical protein
MYMISVQNANRAGLLSTLTLEHIKKGQRGNNESLTVHITKHKTSGVYGGALMSFDLELHAHIVNYVNDVRPILLQDSKGRDNIFVTRADHSLNNFARKTGVLTAATVSKFSSTMVRYSYEHERPLLAAENCDGGTDGPLKEHGRQALHHQHWSIADELAIEKNAAAFIASHGKAKKEVVESLINNSKIMKAIAAREGMQRLVEKIKNFKKKYASNTL